MAKALKQMRKGDTLVVWKLDRLARPARARGRLGGRPRRLSLNDVKVAETLLDGGLGPVEVAKRMGVSRATLFRHLRQAKEKVATIA